MTTRAFDAALSAAVYLLATAGMNTPGRAEVVPCTGPFAHCASEVGARCEKENGRTMIIFYDKSGYSNAYEQCVGKVYEAHGRPNPYAPQPQKPPPKR